MSYGEAAAQFGKLLNKIVDVLLRRNKTKELDSKEELPREIPDSHRTLDALRQISKDLKIPRERVKDGAIASAGDICWTFQVKFRILQLTDDAEEMLEILSFLRKLVSAKVLKRFAAGSPLIPSMLHSLCICCARLDDSGSVVNRTSENERQIRVVAVEVSRVILLPLRADSKRDLYPDTGKAVSDILNMYGTAIAKYSSTWPEEISDQILKTVEFVPSIISLNDLIDRTVKDTQFFNGNARLIGVKDGVQVRPSEIANSLNAFCQHIPGALSVLACEHHEVWIPTLQTLCSKLPPENQRGPLCKLWRRLVLSSSRDGFDFIDNILNETLKFLDGQGGNASNDIDECVVIVGCLNDFMEQCCTFAPHLYGGHWRDHVAPLVTTLKSRRESDQRLKGDSVTQYLEKILEHINQAELSFEEYEAASELEGITPPPTTDPTDSLFGVHGN